MSAHTANQKVVTPDGIMQQCADPLLIADQSGRVFWINPAARLMFKKLASPDELRLSDLFGNEIQQKILESRGHILIPATIEGPDKFPVNLTLISVEIGSGAPASELYLVIAKAIRNDLEQSSLREQMIATLAHDLKNPLGAIFGYSDALLDLPASSKSGMSEREVKVIRKIRRTALRALDLVRNYQFITSQGKTKVNLPRHPIDLNLVVRSVIESCWRAEEDMPQLVIKLQKEALPVRIDRVNLERVISNLFSNAVRYTPPDSKIIIKTERATNRARLIIQNFCDPVPEEDLKEIFKPYKRGASSSGTAGTGLGLYIVKSILDAYGADLTVSSSEAEGFVVTVVFRLF
ncbi:MAG: PAS domain-containing sensor histidine kinase [Candidatus Dadabacteria bacterium]|nr:MAG: PAS domain-containing sensor histidine kinase [Candidatus Dadabacteria bacterium]